jgi:hypothetical protein
MTWRVQKDPRARLRSRRVGLKEVSALFCRAGAVLEVEADGVLLGPNELSALVRRAGGGVGGEDGVMSFNCT